jgi:hypothetical protein
MHNLSRLKDERRQELTDALEAVFQKIPDTA